MAILQIDARLPDDLAEEAALLAAAEQVFCNHGVTGSNPVAGTATISMS
jgi:hypothetical protein